MPHTMPHVARQDKALELIQFLAAFDVTWHDARNIAAIMYQRITKMSEKEYKASGTDLAAMTKAMDDGAAADAHQRIFHEPKDLN